MEASTLKGGRRIVKLDQNWLMAAFSGRLFFVWDLRLLKDMHPLLEVETVADISLKAALALGRSAHASGCALRLAADGTESHCDLHWRERAPEAGLCLDQNRVTEDGADAVALAVVSERHGWAVRRRGQRGEYADWIMRAPDGGPVFLEVSGAATEDGRRLEEKRNQVSRNPWPGVKAALVVEFGPPRAGLATVRVA